MKARIPKHREFIINLAEDYEKKDECWDKLQEIMEAYKKEGKSVYTPTFIEDGQPDNQPDDRLNSQTVK